MTSSPGQWVVIVAQNLVALEYGAVEA